MANICGISIANRTSFKDHEGMTCYQGELYLEGKRIAFWSEDFTGSPWSRLDMAPGYSEEKLRKAVCQARRAGDGKAPDETDISFELLMRELIDLERVEEMYQEAKKSGSIGILISTDGFHSYYCHIPPEYQGMDIVSIYKEELELAHSQFFKNGKIKDKYYTEHDFRVGKAIPEEDIRG